MVLNHGVLGPLAPPLCVIFPSMGGAIFTKEGRAASLFSHFTILFVLFSPILRVVTLPKRVGRPVSPLNLLIFLSKGSGWAFFSIFLICSILAQKGLIGHFCSGINTSNTLGGPKKPKQRLGPSKRSKGPSAGLFHQQDPRGATPSPRRLPSRARVFIRNSAIIVRIGIINLLRS